MYAILINDFVIRFLSQIQFYESLKPLNVQCQALQNRVELSANELLDREEDLAKALKVCLPCAYISFQVNFSTFQVILSLKCMF